MESFPILKGDELFLYLLYTIQKGEKIFQDRKSLFTLSNVCLCQIVKYGNTNGNNKGLKCLKNLQSGGVDMVANQQKLYSELRMIRNELLESLNKNSSIKPLIEDELRDIEETLGKMESGTFGFCESSGEMIPDDYLSIVPTIKSIDDVNEISKYYCKPIYH